MGLVVREDPVEWECGYCWLRWWSGLDEDEEETAG